MYNLYEWAHNIMVPPCLRIQATCQMIKTTSQRKLTGQTFCKISGLFQDFLKKIKKSEDNLRLSRTLFKFQDFAGPVGYL